MRMKQQSLINTKDISPEIAIGEYSLRRTRKVKEMVFIF